MWQNVENAAEIADVKVMSNQKGGSEVNNIIFNKEEKSILVHLKNCCQNYIKNSDSFKNSSFIKKRNKVATNLKQNVEKKINNSDFAINKNRSVGENTVEQDYGSIFQNGSPNVSECQSTKGINNTRILKEENNKWEKIEKSAKKTDEQTAKAKSNKVGYFLRKSREELK